MATSKVIKEIVTDVGGNTTIEYSDDTTQKYNVADVVTAQTNSVTGGISLLAGGSVVNDGPSATGYGRFFSFGDSISADGGRLINASALPDVNFYQYSWQKFAQFGSAGKWEFGGTFGLGGQTIAQLKTTYLPFLLAYAKPRDAVIVLMGQNDLGGINTQTFIDYRSVVDQMLAAGLLPILGTLTPGANTRTFHALNSFIRALAVEKRLRMIDFHAAVVDPSTGLWLASQARDGVHPGHIGAKTMGVAAGAVLASVDFGFSLSTWLANSNAGYGANLTTETGGNPNPLFLVDNAATPPIPTGWGILAGSHASAIALSAAAVGRKMTVTTQSSSSEVILRCTGGSAVAGDDIVVAFWLTTTAEAGSGYVRWALMNGGGAALLDYGRNNAQGGLASVSRSLVFMRAKHTGTTGLLFDFVVGTTNSTPVTAVLEQFTILNLTAMGYTAP